MTLLEKMIFRKLEINDFYKNYLELLQDLTIVNPEKIDINVFTAFVEKLNDSHAIYVFEDSINKVVVGTVTILIEDKIIHDMGKVAHIEDLVVHQKYRGANLGKTLIEKMTEFAKNAKCYKIILDCLQENEDFYIKCQFKRKGLQMAHYNN
jgi:glucosamine-phosphate N-acetyltransferase